MFGKIRTEKAPNIAEKRMKELFLFQQKLNLKFKDISILENAFIHSSYANEAKNQGIKDNERLEFLGDSILSISVSDWLYNNLNVDEGECTRIRSIVVSEDTLSKIARKIGLDSMLVMGKGEEQTGGRNKNAILADCMEAVFASVYLDAGFAKAKEFILSLLKDEIQEVLENKSHKDYKTMLQEYIQKRYKTVPKYTLVRAEGPEHQQTFWYSVEIRNKKFEPVSGHNKKVAEQAAAEQACRELGILD